MLTLSKVCLAYNSSVQFSTRYCPFSCTEGKLAYPVTSFMYDPPFLAIPADKVYGEYVSKQQKMLIKAFEAMRQNISSKQNHQKAFYNRKVHGENPLLLESSLAVQSAIGKGKSRKHFKPWKGPYQI